jgi:uncharacterized protein YegP (UPF0339 family)
MPEEIAKANIKQGETNAIMTRDLGGDRLRITKEQREEILRLYVSGEPRKAQLYAMSLGLREQYAYRLARERGAIPFTSSGYSHRERAENSIPTPLRTVRRDFQRRNRRVLRSPWA